MRQNSISGRHSGPESRCLEAPVMRRFTLASTTTLLVLAWPVLIGCQNWRSAETVRVGTELYAIVPEGIIEVLFSTDDHKVFAYRWNPNDAFQLTVASARERRVEYCVSGEGFRRWLEAVASARVTNEVMKFSNAKNGGGSWARLRLRDSSSLDSIDVQIQMPVTAADPVLMESEARRN